MFLMKAEKCISLFSHFYSSVCVCACAFVYAEALKSQLEQGEEKTSKMKQLLVKTKKDLADVKKQVCVCVCVSRRISHYYV